MVRYMTASPACEYQPSVPAAACDDSDDCDDAPTRMRCCISGCKRQLLSCAGRKAGGSAIGCAEEAAHAAEVSAVGNEP